MNKNAVIGYRVAAAMMGAIMLFLAVNAHLLTTFDILFAIGITAAVAAGCIGICRWEDADNARIEKRMARRAEERDRLFQAKLVEVPDQ